mgnify:CR=1 FL=1
MRSFLKILLITTVVFSSSHLMAQDKNKTLLQTERMAKSLELSDKQKAALDKELKSVQADRKAKAEKLRALKEEMLRDAFVDRQAREKRLKEILTEEQWAKYESHQKKGRQRGQRSNFQRSRGDRGQNGQANFRRRGGRSGQQQAQLRDTVSRRRMVMKRRAQIAKKKELLEKKEKGGDGGN